MKAYIFAFIFAVATAKDFDLKPANSTCIKLSLEGSVELTASENGTQVGKKYTVSFDDFSLVEGQNNCSVIKLQYGDSAVQVWFQSDEKEKQSVTPIAAFVPNVLYQNETSENETIAFTAKAFGSFTGNQSFACKSQLEHDFTTASKTELKFDLKAFTTNLKIEFGQYLQEFSDDMESCPQDTPSTTPAASTSPAAPTSPPTPGSSAINATVKNAEGNVTCIRMEGELTIVINKTTTVVPSSAAITGNCSVNDTTQDLEISFNKDWKLKFTFNMNKDKDVSITQIDLTYDVSKLDTDVEATKTVSISGQTLLKSAQQGYYMCNANKTLLNADLVTLTASNLKYRAFNEDADAKLSGGTVSECPEDEETSSVVPIAVGAALAGLVVIVLVAYLIGRRRSRATGYESV